MFFAHAPDDVSPDLHAIGDSSGDQRGGKSRRRFLQENRPFHFAVWSKYTDTNPPQKDEEDGRVRKKAGGKTLGGGDRGSGNTGPNPGRNSRRGRCWPRPERAT